MMTVQIAMALGIHLCLSHSFPIILPSQLKIDYDQLSRFTDQVETYEINLLKFSSLFREGLKKAIQFYNSPEQHPDVKLKKAIKPFYLQHPTVHAVQRQRMAHTQLGAGIAALNRFAGNWYGLWKETKVAHLWLPVRQVYQSLTDDLQLLAFQSAFTGDGVGWNYLVRYKGEVLLLGFVCHYQIDGKLVAKTPHFAFLDEQGQITWITEDHIFFETVCHQNHGLPGKHYVITGEAYEHKTKKATLVHRFQAIYLATDQALPQFKYIANRFEPTKFATKTLHLLAGFWVSLLK